MAIGLTSRSGTGKKLSPEQKKQAILLITEMKSRGIPIPEGLEISDSVSSGSWNLDENGYFVRNDGWLFKPRPVLEDFIQSRARFILLKSGRGGGKSASGCQKALHKIKQGKSGAVMNPDFENFRTSTWPELQKWIPWDKVVPKHRYRADPSWEAIRPFTIVFTNGAKMYCKGLKDPESARGANLNWFWYDEGRRDPTGLGWKNAIAFLRIGTEPQAWCTTTMAGLEHWTNTFFEGKNTEEVQKLMDELGRQGIDQPLFETFKTSTRENADNLDPVFYASMVSAYPAGYLRTREIEGEAADEGGSLGDRRWFDGKKVKGYPDWVKRWVRFWDLAATEAKILRGKKLNDPDETCGSLIGIDEPAKNVDPRYVIGNQFGGEWEWNHIKEMILQTTKEDIEDLGYVTVVFEQEPASGGKNQIAELKTWLKAELEKRYGIISGYKIDSLEAKKLGDRVLAANTWFAEATTSDLHQGQFYIVDGLWNEKFFQQLDSFDGLKHDDRITSVTGGRHYIAPVRKKWSSVKFLSLGGKK
jgi:phage terminase large subunit-like protein